MQTYLADSYGLNGNIMISQSEYNQFSLKSVCGWLKLQLTGNGEKISSITLRGNNGEQVAGEVYINAYNATSVLASDMGSLPEDDEIAPFYQNNYIVELQKRDTTLNDNLSEITKLRHKIQEAIAFNNRMHDEVKKIEDTPINELSEGTIILLSEFMGQ